MHKNDSLIIFDKEVRFSAHKRKWQVTKGPYTVSIYFDLYSGLKDDANLVCEVKKYNVTIGSEIILNNTDTTTVENIISRLIVYHLQDSKEAEQWAKDQQDRKWKSCY